MPAPVKNAFSPALTHLETKNIVSPDTEGWEKQVNAVLSSPGVMQHSLAHFQFPSEHPTFSPLTVTFGQIASVLNEKVGVMGGAIAVSVLFVIMLRNCCLK